MTAARRWGTVALSVVVVLVLDQLSKIWAVARLCGPPYCPDQPVREPIDLVWTLRLAYAENTGMAFSKASGSGRWIALVAVGIVVVLLLVARRLRSPYQLVLVGVVVGGALGNLLDRLFRASGGFLSGGVVDFIDLQWWPVFNVADACVVVGGILLAVSTVFEPEPESESESDAEPEPEVAPDPAKDVDADAAADADPEPQLRPGPDS